MKNSVKTIAATIITFFIVASAPIFAAQEDGVGGQGSAQNRFEDRGDGTVRDTLTGLAWLKDANCDDAFVIRRGESYNTWAGAARFASGLGSGQCGLSDNSTPGQWRLPTIREFQNLMDYNNHSPALPKEHTFVRVKTPGQYWTSSPAAGPQNFVWTVKMLHGEVVMENKINQCSVWPVREDK